MPATPGWGSDTDHYNDDGTLKPDPGLQTKPKAVPAAQERFRVLQANYQRYVATTDDPEPLSRDEWTRRRKDQSTVERDQENVALGIKPDPSQEVGLQR